MDIESLPSMVGSTGLMKMRLIRSKIRKREDSSVVSAVDSRFHVPHGHQNGHQQQFHQNLTQVVHQGQANAAANNKASAEPVQQQNSNNGNGAWVFPPLPPQPNIYGFNQVSTGRGRRRDAVCVAAPCERRKGSVGAENEVIVLGSLFRDSRELGGRGREIRGDRVRHAEPRQLRVDNAVPNNGRSYFEFPRRKERRRNEALQTGWSWFCRGDFVQLPCLGKEQSIPLDATLPSALASDKNCFAIR